MEHILQGSVATRVLGVMAFLMIT